MARERQTEERVDQEPEVMQAPETGQAEAEEAQVAGPLPPVADLRVEGGATPTPTASEQAYADRPDLLTLEKKMGEQMVEGMNKVNGIDSKYDLDHGVHYSHNYERECREAGKPERWHDDYRMGHQASGLFQQPYDIGSAYDYRLKKGESASKAVKEWLKGLTVAECFTAIVAIQYDTIRRQVGDKKFDAIFGSKDAKVDNAIDDDNRLRIAQESTPVSQYTKATQLAEEGGEATDERLDKGLKPGEWYYFYNHPKYLLKHPDGAWQGENALYMGKNDAGERLWSGMGASNVTEDQMFESMVRSYNANRDENDERAMKEADIKEADGTYNDRRYDPNSGEFKEKITRADVLNDPEYELDGTTRKGGFVLDAGVTFDHEKVKAEKDKKAKRRTTRGPRGG